MTDAQHAYLERRQTLHNGVRWAYVAASPHHEDLPDETRPILVQWRHHQSIRSQMVFTDGREGPLGESAVYV